MGPDRSAVAHEARAVAAGDGEAEAAAAAEAVVDPVDPVHLAQGAALQDLAAAGRAAAKLQGGEAGEVLDGGDDAAHRSDGAGVVVLHGLPGAVGALKHVGRRQALQDLSVRRGARARHAQRVEDALVNVGGPRPAGHLGHDLPEQGHPEVRVVVGRLGRVDEALPGDRFGQLLAGREHVVGPVGEVGLPGQARGVGEKLPDRDIGCVRERVGHLEPREVARHGVVEAKLARIPQLQDRGGGEELGDRADPVDGGRCRRDLPLEIAEAVPLRPHDLLVVNDRDREPGQVAVGEVLLDPPVEDRDGVGDCGLLRKRRLGGRKHRDHCRQQGCDEHRLEAHHRAPFRPFRASNDGVYAITAQPNHPPGFEF